MALVTAEERLSAPSSAFHVTRPGAEGAACPGVRCDCSEMEELGDCESVLLVLETRLHLRHMHLWMLWVH